jgi:hypothetical protein
VESTATDVDIGAEVFTADGKRLGRVKEIAVGRFKVDMRWKADFWLSASTIGNSSAGRLTTSFPRRKLNEHKL